jgi:hypothetical protein
MYCSYCLPIVGDLYGELQLMPAVQIHMQMVETTNGTP